MMEALHSWIRNLILVVIFASFIQIIVPGNTFNRYVRVVMGFFIIITLLNPILVFLELELKSDHLWPVGEVSSYQEIARKGEELRHGGEEDLLRMVKRDLEREMGEFLKEEGFSFLDLTVSFNGKGPVGVRVSLFSSSAMNWEERRKKEEEISIFFFQRYQIPSSSLYLVWKEGSR